MRQDEYTTLGTITDGTLALLDTVSFVRTMRRFADGPVVVEVKTIRPQRSSAQNRYWHGVVIPLFADHCGYEFDEMKDALALRLIPKDLVDMSTGEVHTVPGHTSDLNVKEFNDLIERAQRLGAEMDIYIPDPNEVAA